MAGVGVAFLTLQSSLIHSLHRFTTYLVEEVDGFHGPFIGAIYKLIHHSGLGQSIFVTTISSYVLLYVTLYHVS